MNCPNQEMRMRNLAATVLSLGVLVSISAQQPEPSRQQNKPEETDVVRITTNLVQVDATITDKSGRQITDLRPEEFEVRQDGKLQTVTHLSYIATSAAGAGSVAKPPALRGNIPPASIRLRPEQVRRTIAIVVDDLGLSFVSTALVRKALTRYIEEQMQPGDLVAIIRTSAGAGALQQFTSDRRQLLAAVDQVRWYPLGRGTIAAFSPLQPNETDRALGRLERSDDTDQRAVDAARKLSGTAAATQDAVRRLSETSRTEQEELGQLREEAFAVGTLGAVNFVVHGLERLPGRKSIILLSDGFKLFTSLRQDSKPRGDDNRIGIKERDTPSTSPNTLILGALKKLTDSANRASVVIYTMDTRGLQSFALTAEDNVADASPDQIEQQLLDRKQNYLDTQAGLAYLARLTGGFPIQNENDLNKGLQRVLDDQSGYYLIGYRPDDSTFDPKTGRPNFHKITVKVKRGGLKVRSRSGFFGVSDDEARKRVDPTDLAVALASPFGTSDIRMRLTSLFGNDDRIGSLMSSVLFIDAHDLTFKEEPEGWREAEVEVAAYTFGAFGEVVDSLSRTHKIRARGDLYESMLRDGLLYTVSVPIKKAGAYQLRIAVRDSASRRLSTASQFIEVPDLARDRLALSGIFLSGLDPAKAKQSADGSPLAGESNDVGDPQASPAIRRLRSGMEMHYAYYIYNAKLDVTRHPQLTTQVRLFHNGQLAYEGKMTPYDAGQEPDLKRLRAGGQIKLSAKAAPGEYLLQVIITDSLRRKQNTASQWMDFEIVK
jgi:VWFA-related protein